MYPIQSTDYYEFDEALRAAQASIGAPECHGLLAGLVCACGGADRRQWLAELFDDVNPQDTVQADATRQVNRVQEEIIADLNSPELEFVLLLPDDEDPLTERVQALGGWCHGFLSGLGLGGLREEQALPEDAREMLLDIGRIANVDFQVEAVDEEDAAAYEEVAEYVRMGAIYIHEVLQPGQPGPSQIQ